MADTPTAEPSATRRLRARERRKFEGWMRRYWGGIELAVQTLGRHEFEYKEAAAQTAWEVWQRFTGLKS